MGQAPMSSPEEEHQIHKCGEKIDTERSFCFIQLLYSNSLAISFGILVERENSFLNFQGEVEQIAMMKPKAQSEHDEGMLEFL